MDTSSQPSANNVADSINNLSIPEPKLTPSSLAVPLTELNPWQDQPGTSSPLTKPMELHTSDLSTIDNPIYVLPDPASTPVPEHDRDAHAEEVLNEFDPLTDRGEQAAREAWASAESHPPPPQSTPVPQPDTSILDSVSPEPPPKDIPVLQTQPPSDPPVASGSNFPSLASLARSFSIPTIVRPRPTSIDVARAVPSPATLSSFSVQQDQQPHDPENSIAVIRSSTPEANGTDSPRPGRDQDKEPTFDFQKFLDQMKLKSADPVAKFLRSRGLRFLSNFAKRTFTVSDQIKIINDFLNFISARMRETDVWRNATDAEFDNAMEGMEKLVMNRLYEFTFTPQVSRMVPPRPVTADDLERDRVLSQRIALFGWIEEKHLDIPQGDGNVFRPKCGL
ncbi:hypothetical protein PILCRDRAFT_84425 [Piloderma croceum F 1598]|uniref:RABX5 catalytic core helical domain-containing protein n=1 Tax=Piloderma croceum (strain F 1598) TaxID=765440 RepID=A0A0C3GID8_PILCF|nr:hypothetical protein PILCRDRAFT_84425 [Piloderma croceum F 1598]